MGVSSKVLSYSGPKATTQPDQHKKFNTVIVSSVWAVDTVEDPKMDVIESPLSVDAQVSRGAKYLISAFYGNLISSLVIAQGNEVKVWRKKNICLEKSEITS